MKIPFVLLLLGLTLILPVAAQQENPADPAKAIIVELNIQDGAITYRDSRVVYGYPPDNIANRDFGVEIVGNGITLDSLGIEDPRILHLEDGAILEDDVDFSVIVPFYADAESVRILNGTTNETLIAVDVEPAIAEFYSQYPQARQGAAGESPAPTAKVPLPAGIAIIALTLSMLIFNCSKGKR